MVSHLVNLTDEPTLCSPLQRVHLLLPQLQRPGGQRHPHDGAALLLPPGRGVPRGPRGDDGLPGGEGGPGPHVHLLQREVEALPEPGVRAEAHGRQAALQAQDRPGKCSTVPSLISICVSVLQFAATVEHSENVQFHRNLYLNV